MHIRNKKVIVVVDENDALLIYPKAKEQEIKQVTETIKKLKGQKYL